MVEKKALRREIPREGEIIRERGRDNKREGKIIRERERERELQNEEVGQTLMPKQAYPIAMYDQFKLIFCFYSLRLRYKWERLSSVRPQYLF